ncbi:hypothetical protein T265_09112 [Opisthorchis viverrini]|uniref:Uncharacterized protein n=1 Tax=Opisthorchis viverrini TaxID=6198 RepID=A0A074Z6R0_OPIVI|nr:hypothetical protein T265_09112 [Opisthorchis viverrini]KER22876.1 hypothetical protein T265_09112 [Opisthorchis viverrini]
MVWFMENMLMLLSLGNHRRIRVFGYIALFSFLLKKANFEPTFDIHEPTTFAITLRMLIEQAKYRILHASGDVVPKLRQMWNHEKFQLTEFYSRPRYPSVCSRLVNETKDLMSCILHQITSTIPQQGLLSPQCQWGIRALGFTMQYYPEGYFFEFEKVGSLTKLSSDPLSYTGECPATQTESLIPGWSMVRGLTNTVSWPSRLGVGTCGDLFRRNGNAFAFPAKHRCLAVRLLSQRLWLRTLIVLLSRCGRPGSIPAHVQP